MKSKTLYLLLVISLLIGDLPANKLTAKNLSTGSLKKAASTVIPIWDSIKQWSFVQNQGWLLSNRTFNLVYDNQRNLLSSFDDTSNPPFSTVVYTRGIVNKYDAKNNLVSSIRKIYLDSTWFEQERTTIVYDANNNILEYLYEEKTDLSSDFITNIHSFLTYDVQGNNISRFDSTLTNIIERKYNYYKFNYSYDSKRNIINTLEQNLKIPATFWLITKNVTNTYDNNNNKIIQLDSFFSITGVFQSIYKNHFTNTYDASKNLLIHEDSTTKGRLVYTYDERNNMLSSAYIKVDGIYAAQIAKKNYTYDAVNNLTSKTDSIFHWSGGTAGRILININKIFYTYDVNKNVTSELSQGWTGGNSNTFWDGAKITYTYNTDENLYLKVSKYYDKAGAIVGGDSTFYYEGNGSTGVKGVNSNITFLVFPNPFISSTTIKLITNKNISANVKLFDMLGNEVKSILVTNNEATIERENLGNGIYFYNIISDDKLIATGKLIIE
jgi:hypothetical protein